MSRPVLPASRAGWWATGLSWLAVAAGLLLPVVSSRLGPLRERLGRGGLPIGFSLVAVELLLAAAAIVLAVVAWRAKDRALLLLAGFALVMLVGGFWVVFALGEALLPQ